MAPSATARSALRYRLLGLPLGLDSGMEEAHKVVTLQDVADLVGVHKSTVHRALRGDPRVEAKTTEKVRSAAAALGYDPDVNQAARRLSLRKTGRSEPTRLIALLFPVVFTHGSYFQRLFTSFIETLSESHYDVLTRIHDQAGLQLPPIVTRGEADAVAMLGHPETLEKARAAMAALPTSLRRPIISMLYPVEGMWNVCADLRLGGRMEMDHLLDLGHRRIITIGSMAFGVEDRVAGCRDALQSRGLDPDRHLTVAITDLRITDEEQRLADVLDRLLAASPDATAMLAPHDPAAQRLMHLLAERGRPVPESMSLVGFDDTDPVVGAGGQNVLTTVALPLEQIGRESARLAMDPGAKPRRITLPVGLRVRGTTKALVS